MAQTAEHVRLLDDGAKSKDWGPYLSERQWGTVREDYSDKGDAWNYFSHDQVRSQAYRWGEVTGALSICLASRNHRSAALRPYVA